MPRRKRSEAGRGRLVALVSATTFLAGAAASGLALMTLAPEIAPAPDKLMGPLRHLGGIFAPAPPREATPGLSPAVLLIGDRRRDEPPAASPATLLAIDMSAEVPAPPATGQGVADFPAIEPGIVDFGTTGDADAGAAATADPAPLVEVAMATPAAGGEEVPPPGPELASLEASATPLVPLTAETGSDPALENATTGDESGESEETAAAGQVVVVRRGDTLLDILTRVGVASSEAHEVVSSMRAYYDPRHLKIGQALQIGLDDQQSAEGAIRLASLSLNVDFENDLRLRRDESGTFTAETVERELVRETAYAQGAIDGSLYEAARSAGVPLDTLQEVIKIFSWDVDFQRDIQPGNRFELLYDRLSLDQSDEVRGAGVRFAALALGSRTIEAYRFKRSDGSEDLYDAAGRPLRKWLMKTPIDGARLSSTFGPRRHPVLGYNRMHKGTDFAAPTGTPIYAAGDGIIEFAGRNKGYGNYVRVRHNDTFSTAYAHMSRFAKGTKRNQRVRQGEVIGYVGTTGLSTGPHLHYELLKNGTQINPQSIEKVAADPLKGRDLKRFEVMKAAVDAARGITGRQLVAGKE